MKVFIIEDDKKIREKLVRLLENYGYIPLVSDDFENIILTALSVNADLILLDINLPYYDGLYVCREIRKSSEVPIIMLTSRNTETDELISMNFGADDFITKPYNSSILIAHIAAVLKRYGSRAPNDKIEYKGICFDKSKSLISSGSKVLELTKNEFKILSYLLSRKGTIVSRSDIINELWQSDEFIDDNTLTVNVNRLRKKIEQIGIKDFIQTKRGRGYLI
jgi:DNA-binding response OmpR family regulator